MEFVKPDQIPSNLEFLDPIEGDNFRGERVTAQYSHRGGILGTRYRYRRMVIEGREKEAEYYELFPEEAEREERDPTLVLLDYVGYNMGSEVKRSFRWGTRDLVFVQSESWYRDPWSLRTIQCSGWGASMSESSRAPGVRLNLQPWGSGGLQYVATTTLGRGVLGECASKDPQEALEQLFQRIMRYVGALQ